MSPEADDATLDAAAATIRERMVNRVWFVGSSKQTAGQIEESFRDTVDLLDAHLDGRPYLFGSRPAFADFGLWGQLYNAFRDPTPNDIMKARGPRLVEWIERMHEPTALGPFEPWAALSRTLEPLLADQVAGLFLPWSRANAEAIESGAESFTIRLRSGEWTQKPQKYHARSLIELRQRFQQERGAAELDALLERTGCLPYLLG